MRINTKLAFAFISLPELLITTELPSPMNKVEDHYISNTILENTFQKSTCYMTINPYLS